MSSKRRKSSCPFTKKAPQREKSGKKGLTFHQNWADALAASDKGSYFLGAFVVRSGNSNILAQSESRGRFLHVVCECALSLSTTSLS